MGFLFAYSPARAKRDPFHGISAEYMAASGCTDCPLREQGKAYAVGPLPAMAYMLGEAPGDVEVRQGEPWVGPAGRLLRKHIPADWLDDCRFNNVVMSQPFRKDRQQLPPTPAAIAHCRGYLIEDIEAATPKAIFGFGNTPLTALTGQSGITKFAGRRLPVQVGRHLCWYYAFLHPAAILRADERQRPDLEAVLGWQLQAAFASLPDLQPPHVVTATEARANIQVLTDAGRIVRGLQQAMACARVGLDYETTGLSPYADDARILTVAVAMGDAAFAFPLAHPAVEWSTHERACIHLALMALLESSTVKVAHHTAFEMLWSLRFFGRESVRPNHWGDSLVQAFLLDTRPRTHSLDFLCQMHFGLPLKALSNLDIAHLADAPVEQVCRYNAMDAKYCLKVFETQQPVLERVGLQPQYRHHMARIAALVCGQHLGLPVDLKVNYALNDQYASKLTKIAKRLAKLPEVQAFERTGQRFNVASTKHVLTVLHSAGIHLDDTAEATLAAVGGPFVKAVLDYRGTSKVLSTYLLPLGPDSQLVHKGKLHPVIATTHTRTWRTASEEPNIQNWPTRDAADRIVRKQVVARPGTLMVSVDYSGIQARNVAMESKDRKLVDAFIHRYDIHQDWSERVQRLLPRWAGKRPAKDLRHLAKNRLVFPLFFGARPPNIAAGLGVDIDTAHRLFADFWGEFPDILGWHQKLRRFYKRHHYVTGLSGFRRPAPISDNQLINTPIQSDEALIVCEAMTRLSQYEQDALQPCMMVHDDLTFMLPLDSFDACVDTILREMLRIEHIWINVPLAVEVKAGLNWAEQIPLGHFESDGLGGYVELPK